MIFSKSSLLFSLYTNTPERMTTRPTSPATIPMNHGSLIVLVLPDETGRGVVVVVVVPVVVVVISFPFVSTTVILSSNTVTGASFMSEFADLYAFNVSEKDCATVVGFMFDIDPTFENPPVKSARIDPL